MMIVDVNLHPILNAHCVMIFELDTLPRISSSSHVLMKTYVCAHRTYEYMGRLGTFALHWALVCMHVFRVGEVI